MTRIDRFRPDELTSEQRAVYDAIAGGPRAAGPRLFDLTDGEGRLEGPFNAMLLQPALGDAVQRLGSAIRYQGGLSGRARELSILLVAAHWQSPFEQYAHEHVGRHAGLTDTEIEAVRPGGELALDDPAEIATVRVTRLLLDHRRLTDEEYAEAVAVLGPPTLFEITTLVGYYAMLALQMRVFAVD